MSREEVRDIRSVSREHYGKMNQRMVGKSQADFIAREKSLNPVQPLSANTGVDPVHSIPNQNPTAQPGYGYALFTRERTDIAQIYGIQDRKKRVPKINLELGKLPEQSVANSDVSADSIERRYYSQGKRPSGSVYYVNNQPSFGFSKEEKPGMARKNQKRRRDKHCVKAKKAAIANASVSYPQTSLNPADNPPGYNNLRGETAFVSTIDFLSTTTTETVPGKMPVSSASHAKTFKME